MPTGLTKKFLSASDDSYTMLFAPCDENDTEIRCNNLGPWAFGDKVLLTLDRIDINGNEVPGKKEKIYAEIGAANWLINCVRGIDGTTPQSHGTNCMVEDLITSTHLEAIREGLSVTMNEDGTLKSNIIAQAQMQDNSVGTAELIDLAISTAKLANNSATTSKLKVNYATLTTPHNGSASRSASAAAYTVPGSLLVYTTGPTPELIILNGYALIQNVSGGGGLIIQVGGVSIGRRTYVDVAGQYMNHMPTAHFEAAANTTYTFSLYALPSGTATVCNAQTDVANGFHINLNLIALGR